MRQNVISGRARFRQLPDYGPNLPALTRQTASRSSRSVYEFATPSTEYQPLRKLPAKPKHVHTHHPREFHRDRVTAPVRGEWFLALLKHLSIAQGISISQ